MNRRTYLGAIGAAGTLSTTGCLGSILGTGDDRTVLGPPEEERGDPSHPIHGDDLPDFSIPDPIAGEEISNEEFEGERSLLVTFVYTNCPDGVCPALLQRLRQAQADAAAEGYEDEVAFLPVTFDPERDTADVLAEYGDQFDVDYEAGNWHFLRPETYEEASEVVFEDFGLPIERFDDPEEADHDHGDDDGSDSGDDHDHDDGDDSDDGDDHDHDDGDDSDDDHDGGNESAEDEYTFTHFDLILLVNDRGVVERAYPRAMTTDVPTIVDDLRTVVEG